MSQELIGVVAHFITEGVIGLCIVSVSKNGFGLTNDVRRYLLLGVFPDVKPLPNVVHHCVFSIKP